MKRTSISTAVLTVAALAMGAGPAPVQFTPAADGITKISRTEAVAGQNAPLRAPRQMSLKAPAGPTGDEKIITEAPAGTARTYVKTDGTTYSYSWLTGVSSLPLGGALCNIVTTDDGKVYMNNPFSSYISSTPGWLEGTLEGDMMTFRFPQLIQQDIYYNEDGSILAQYDYFCMPCSLEEQEGGGNWYEPTEDQVYSLRVNSDGTLTPTDPNLCLGRMNWYENEDGSHEWSWQGQGDRIYGMAPFEAEVAEIPASVTMEEWNFIEPMAYRPVYVGFEGNNVYVRGIYADIPESVITGTLDGDKVTFKSGQFIGIDTSLNRTAYFVGGQAHYTTTDEGERYWDFTPGESLTFNWDADKKILSTEESMMIAPTAEAKAQLAWTDYPRISAPDANPVVTALQTPVITWFMLGSVEYNYPNMMMFDFPSVDADGQALPLDNLFFNIIINDEVQTLYTDEYLGLSEDIEDVPYNLSIDSWDIVGGNTAHTVYIYPNGMDNLGIRTGYRNGDQVIYSETAWVDPAELSSVKAVESAEVTSQAWYDLTGRRVLNPDKGIYIRVSTLSDGTLRTDKIAR